MPPGKNRPSKPAVCPQLGMRWACLEKRNKGISFEFMNKIFHANTLVPSDFLNTEVKNINTVTTVNINNNNAEIISFVQI